MDSSNSSDLRMALGANAAFSLFTGAVLAAAPGTVGGWLGVDIDGWLRMLGLALIGHAIVLALASRRADPLPWAKLNLRLIAPYPLLMIVLVATGLVDRQLGQVLALADGGVVGLIAIGHWLGLRRRAQAVTSPQPV